MALGIRTDVQSWDEVRRSLNQIVMHLERLSAVTAGSGASMIGYEDAGGKTTAADLETIVGRIVVAVEAHGIAIT